MNLAEANSYARKILNCKWVKWIHQGSVPAETSVEKAENVERSIVNPKHCASCLNMNGCCFVAGKSPTIPLHHKCHCYLENVYGLNVRATSVIEKYTKYIFNEEKNKGKKALFEEWGYTMLDSYYIKEEIERQAQLLYQCGDYQLGKRDGHGQRINIVVNLKRKDTGETVSFITGWMSYPNGRLVLATPYGGN